MKEFRESGSTIGGLTEIIGKLIAVEDEGVLSVEAEDQSHTKTG